MRRIIIIVVLLTLVGFNVFYYLGRVGDYTHSTTKKVVDKTLTQSKVGIEKVASSTDKMLDILEEDIEREKPQGPIERGKRETIYKPDNINSSIQKTGKQGYCYIGSDNSQRVCLRVGENDTCLSQQIYPTMDVCINPNLRP